MTPLQASIYFAIFEYLVSKGVKQSLATHCADRLTEKTINELNRYIVNHNKKKDVENENDEE